MNSTNRSPCSLGRAARMRGLCCQKSCSSSARANDFALDRLARRRRAPRAGNRGGWSPARCRSCFRYRLTCSACGNRLARRSSVPLTSIAPRAGSWPGLGSASAWRLELVGGEQAAVGHARPVVAEVDDAADLGLERLADLVEQVGQGRVVGRFRHAGPGGADRLQFGQILGKVCWAVVPVWLSPLSRAALMVVTSAMPLSVPSDEGSKDNVMAPALPLLGVPAVTAGCMRGSEEGRDGTGRVYFRTQPHETTTSYHALCNPRDPNILQGRSAPANQSPHMERCAYVTKSDTRVYSNLSGFSTPTRRFPQ